MVYARVDFGDAEVKPELRNRWQGRLVSLAYGCGWSLVGYPDEGVGITCTDDCLKPLTEEEAEIAYLLDETFWLRRDYTEDLEFLRRLVRRAEGE